MEPAGFPYSPCRRSGRRNAGVRSNQDDMVYYGPESQSPRPNSREGLDATHGTGTVASDPFNYAFYFALTLFPPAALRNQRAISEVVAASSPSTSEEQRPGARGPEMPSDPRQRPVPRNAPDALVDAAVVARVAEQERRIAELNQAIQRLEGARRAGAHSSGPRTAAFHIRERDGAVDTPAATRQRTATGRQETRTVEHRDEPLAPMVEAALSREVRQANTAGVATAGMRNWANRLQHAHKFLPGMDDGWK
ncbi:unnamed protein product, partial [Closterium sp. NIES-53]